MEPLVFIMAILGCADDEGLCREQRIQPASYRTADACLAASQSALEANSDLPFPVLRAECRRASSSQLARADRRVR
jgi:hypothetical protein